MSYSTKIKSEIIDRTFDKEGKVACLSAIIKNSNHNINEITVSTENIDYANLIISLFKEIYNIDINIGVRKN